MDNFLTKPLIKEQLQELIFRYCSISTEIPEKRILIVEDDTTSMKVLTSSLNLKYPHNIIKSASNGIEACTKVGSFHPHVIILDLVLPDMDGVGVLDFLQKSEKYKQIQVIILTGLPRDSSLRVKASTYSNCFAIVEKQSHTDLSSTLNEIL